MIETEQLMAGMDGQPQAEGPYDFQKDFWLALPHNSEEFAAKVAERFQLHLDEWDNSPIGGVIWLAYRAYHNLGSSDGDPIAQLVSTGEQGELLALALPHYRSLVKNQMQLFTRERPVWEPQARTAGSEAARQVPAVANLLDYVASLGVLDRRVAEQVELMMVAGAGYHITGWDSNVGYAGWFTQSVYAPWEMAHERVRRYEDCTWWIARDFASRWAWVAHWAEADPEKARQIAEYDCSLDKFASVFLNPAGEHEDTYGDRIPVLRVIAKPTKACPGGRYALILGDSIILEDGPYPFGEDVTVSRMCASEFLGTSMPFSDSWGVLAAAEAFNAIISMILTRVDTCGVPNFAVPKGSELTYSDIAGGNQVWELGPGGKPEVVDMLRIPPELPAVLQLLSGEMEKIVGINSVTRGQPQENVSSGSMAALLQSMAIEFNNNLERAWILNLERIGTHHLRVFQQMGSQEQAVSVCGEDHSWTTQMMKGEDVKDVLRVSVKTANALSKTTAGRVAIADKLIEMREDFTPQQYIKVIQTGQLESEFAGPTNELNLIKSENEKIKRGEPVACLRSDNHQLHIREHRSNNDANRDDFEFVQRNEQHIQEHYMLWGQMSREDPDFCAAIGIPPLPQAFQVGQMGMQMQQQSMGMPPMPPQGGPSAGPGPAQQKQPGTEPAKSAPGPKAAPPGAEPSQGHPKEPQPAKPANNPMTGQPVTG